MAGFSREEIDAKLKEPMPEGIDAAKDHEVHTDRDMVKLVGCRECQRPMVVTQFFAPAKAICTVCEPRDAEGGRKQSGGAVGVPQPGRTDPAKATNLADCLVNKPFARALCPVHPDDESHVMELKHVTHSEHYGPGHWAGKTWRQTAPGETCLHQCTACNATVAYSTMQVVQFRQQNEARQKPDFGPPHRNSMMEVRGPDPTILKGAAA